MMYLYMSMIVMTTSLIGMDISPTPALLIKEIIEAHFVPCLTLQEMSRLKRTCKGHRDMINTEALLEQKHSFALSYLFNNFSYDYRTLIISHYAVTDNRQMFQFLWNKEKKLRDDDVMYFDVDASELLGYCMSLYTKEYSTPQKIQQVRLQQLETTAWIGESNSRFGSFLKTILPGSGFNMWDVKIASSKKFLSFLSEKKETKNFKKKIIKYLCASQSIDLLLASMNGIIEPRAFKYVFEYSDRIFIEILREKDAFISFFPDKHGKTFYDYVRKYEFHPR